MQDQRQDIWACDFLQLREAIPIEDGPQRHQRPIATRPAIDSLGVDAASAWIAFLY